MKIEEALKALNDGKRIKRKGDSSSLCYQIKGKSIISCGVSLDTIVLDYEDLTADIWEVVNENPLNELEKEYLEDLLRPYKYTYEFTFEKKLRNNQLYLEISLIPSADGPVEKAFLPISRIGHMFDRLEENCLYLIDDLGLFKK